MDLPVPLLHLYLEEIAVKQGYVYSFLETGKENIAAIATYEKLGYLKIENTGFLKGRRNLSFYEKRFKKPLSFSS